MAKLQTVLAAGAGVGVTAWGLGRLYSFLFPEGVGSATLTFSTFPLQGLEVNVRDQVLGGLNTDIVSQLLSAVAGGAGNIGMGFLLSILAGIVIVWLGTMVTPFFRGLGLPTGKKPVGKHIAMLFYGTVVSSIIAGFIAGNGAINLPGVGVALALIAYFGIVSLVYGWLSNQTKQLPNLN